MKVLDLCKKRYSVRDFTGESVDDDVLQYVLEAGRWAATARNRQARRFVVIDEPGEIDALVHEASMQDFVSDAGVLIFGVATDPQSSGAMADVIISLTQMELAAVQRGLGTIWLGIWGRESIHEKLMIPDDHHVLAALALGHPSSEGHPKSKLPPEELFRFGKFTSKDSEVNQ